MNDYIVRGIAAGGQIRVFAATTRNVVETARQHHEMSPIATVASWKTSHRRCDDGNYDEKRLRCRYNTD